MAIVTSREGREILISWSKNNNIKQLENAIRTLDAEIQIIQDRIFFLRRQVSKRRGG